MQRDTESALCDFQKAVDAGYSNYRQISSDPRLEGLHSDPKFSGIIEQVREHWDYLYIHRNASSYSLAENKRLPKFIYQPASDSRLAKFRKLYRLDSIAGAGDEVSKFISLMKWVHNAVPHDGDIPNPKKMNALNLLSLCKKEKRGLGCRGLATILNEAYLSLGFRSRILACMPKDTADHECHVVTIVFSEDLHKWVWMDPTNEAYLTDKNGVFLSAEEIRQKLILGEPIILNLEANVNNTFGRTEENYVLSYLAKDLYWFESPVSSEFDFETLEENKRMDYVRLYPQDERLYEGDMKFDKGTVYITMNPRYFWQPPL